MNKLDKYLNIVNEEKIKRGLENFVPLYPMLRYVNDVLYVAVMLVEKNDSVWVQNSNIKSKYWVLIDLNTDVVVEFNDTSVKDFVEGNFIDKNIDNKKKEISMYTTKKVLEYKNYLLNDIRNEELPIQKKLASVLNGEFEIDGEFVNINEYLVSVFEQDLSDKINDLVNILVQSKYSSITFYYEQIFNSIINEYIQNKSINTEKIKLCVEIMNNYYDGVIGIDNMFNVF